MTRNSLNSKHLNSIAKEIWRGHQLRTGRNVSIALFRTPFVRLRGRDERWGDRSPSSTPNVWSFSLRVPVRQVPPRSNEGSLWVEWKIPILQSWSFLYRNGRLLYRCYPSTVRETFTRKPSSFLIRQDIRFHPYKRRPRPL